MVLGKFFHALLPAALLLTFVTSSQAQSFRVQCPDHTALHPRSNAPSPPYTGPSGINGAIKCQHISGGDGYSTMADGTQSYMFSFGPLSGLGLIAEGLPGTQLNAEFNRPFVSPCLDYLNTGICSKPNPTYTGGPPNLNGAVRLPADIMNIGVLNGNIPAPLMAIDEDDEFFLTLSNVGMIMRPDLFEQHTVHFHGYPNASSFYDGVPDASAAINIGGSFTYYYLAPDAGTYFWHCHITPPEHLQMGMVGQLYVRPRQNRVPADGATTLFSSLELQQRDLRTACSPHDILCSTPLPAPNSVLHTRNYAGVPTKYAYNDGDGTTRYDVELPLQIHGFDPNFHFVAMTFNPEGFSDMKDKHFLLNGRSYPDTAAATYSDTPATAPTYQATEDSDGQTRPSQPLAASLTLHVGERALLRISDLDVSEFQTLASYGIPMQVIALNARLLRDEAGNNMYYTTNSITLGGGESLDVILDTQGIAPGTYFLYTPQLDHLSNDAENFGGLMAEINVIK